jgi:outer membrane protein assembly factor BamB
MDGKELWRKDVGKMTHIWGNASSPILWKNLAILWCGPGSQQTLLAVDKSTAKTVWDYKEPGGNGTETRPYIGSWVTPIVVTVNGHDELILTVPGKVKAFDPSSGKELWSCDGLANPDGDKVEYASVVVADGIVVAMAGYGGAALAVPAGGHGDVTSKRLWYHPRNPQQIGSPVIVDGHVYALSDTGLAQCLDLKTGKDSWAKARTTSSTWASLVAADGRLYVTNRDGETLVIAAKPEFELLAKNRLEEPVYGSIGVSNGELFIRSYKHLWCIGPRK